MKADQYDLINHLQVFDWIFVRLHLLRLPLDVAVDGLHLVELGLMELFKVWFGNQIHNSYLEGLERIIASHSSTRTAS